MIIYETLNLINGRKYIGQDSKNDSTYLGSGKILLSAVKKYGKENFHKTVLERCSSQKELDSKELFWIKKFNAVNSSEYYNIAEGGQKNKGTTYSKVWLGVKSPDGHIYRNIKNISQFAKVHGLDHDKLRQVARGSRYSYKGWSTLVRERLESSGFTGKKHNQFSKDKCKGSLIKTFSCRDEKLEQLRAKRISVALTDYHKQHKIIEE